MNNMTRQRALFLLSVISCLFGKVATFFHYYRSTFRGTYSYKLKEQLASDTTIIMNTTFTNSNLNYKTYIWKHDYKIGYVTFGDESNPPLLLIPGFGVGAFHYERNIPTLAKDYHVFSLDLLGQGSSWPSTRPTQEQQLRYSIDTWLEQISYFIDNVVRKPVHVAGNSLGGYLAVCLAATKSNVIKSLILINAAPFWSFQPSKETLSNSFLTSILSNIWDGTLPAPEALLKFGSFYYNNLRKPETVNSMLSFVYKNPDSPDEFLVNNIIKSADNELGQEAFTSILFSPKFKLEFLDMIKDINRSIPICLLYGKDDPWIVPHWAQQIKNTKPSVEYYELSPSGHCPHHETPTAINAMIKLWIDREELSVGGKKGVGTNDENDVFTHRKSYVEGVYRFNGPEGEVTVKRMSGKPTNAIESLIVSMTSGIKV